MAVNKVFFIIKVSMKEEEFDLSLWIIDVYILTKIQSTNFLSCKATMVLISLRGVELNLPANPVT